MLNLYNQRLVRLKVHRAETLQKYLIFEWPVMFINENVWMAKYEQTLARKEPL